MKILLTGGAGFIGSHIAEAYLAEGHEVRVIDNLATGRRANVPGGARLHEVDVLSGDAEEVFAEFRPEIVNHLAAQASVKVSANDPVLDLEVNGGGTARVAQLAARHGARKLIYAASGGTAYGQPRFLPVTEEHPLEPVSNYGASKLAGELYVRLFARTQDLDFTILRYGNAYGPRQDPHGEAGVVAIFTGLMLAREQCVIDGDGEQRKDYIYVGDMARANIVALEKGSGGTYNIGTGAGITVNHIFKTLSNATGNSIGPRHGPPRAGDVRDFWLDWSLAERDLGWRPETAFEEGIRRTVESFRE